MVGSACVVAQLDLLKRAALIFGWTIDEAQINQFARRGP